MRYALRNWKCTNCGRPNQTMIDPDGSVKCAHCAHVVMMERGIVRNTEISGQPSRSARPAP